MAHHALLVSNQRAGHADESALEIAARRLGEVGWTLDIAHTATVAEAHARIAAHQGDVVIACGGDGTVHATLQALDPARHILGIIPLGSGNDIYRNTGQGHSVDEALVPMLADKIARWDFGTVGTLRFLNSAGVGLDADTLMTRQRVKGPLRRNYTALFLLTLSRLKPFRAQITIDGVVREEVGYWFIVANGPWIGGGMHITPGGVVTDGKFDILCVGNVGKLKLLRALPKVFKGEHLSLGGMNLIRGSAVSIATPAMPKQIAVDGDLAGTTPVTFQMHAGELRVFSQAG